VHGSFAQQGEDRRADVAAPLAPSGTVPVTAATTAALTALTAFASFTRTSGEASPGAGRLRGEGRGRGRHELAAAEALAGVSEAAGTVVPAAVVAS
jgi:hypothetical protein